MQNFSNDLLSIILGPSQFLISFLIFFWSLPLLCFSEFCLVSVFVFGQECLILKFISVFPLHNYVLYFKGLIFICLFLFFLHSASKVTIMSLLGICTSFQNPLNSQLSGGKFTVLISGADPLSSKCGNLYSNFLIALCRARAKGKCGIPRSKSRAEKVPLKILKHKY